MNRESWLYYWLKSIKNEIDVAKFKAKWRKMNTHNGTIPGGCFLKIRLPLGI